MIKYTSFPSEFGPVFIAKAGRGICRIHLGGSEDEFKAVLKARVNDVTVRDDVALSLEERELRTYLEDGKAVDHMRVELREGTRFERRVWETLRQIPYGEVRSYGWVAERIGNPKASRAVGGACGSNPVPFVIPCHRVIASDGSLGGYGYGLPVKRHLLKSEGIDLSTLRH